LEAGAKEGSPQSTGTLAMQKHGIISKGLVSSALDILPCKATP